MKKTISEDLKGEAIDSYIREYIVEKSTVSSVPDALINYQNEANIYYYEQIAATHEMTLEEYLSSSMGVDSVETLKETNAESYKRLANYYLIVQAFAEDMQMTPNDDDVKNYFSEHMNVDDYSSYEEQYGMPYLRQAVLTQMVLDRLTENARTA